jgi:ABC-type dipeptide/oligopeptide/nickel transport system permease component
MAHALLARMRHRTAHISSRVVLTMPTIVLGNVMMVTFSTGTSVCSATPLYAAKDNMLGYVCPHPMLFASIVCHWDHWVLQTMAQAAGNVALDIIMMLHRQTFVPLAAHLRAL